VKATDVEPYSLADLEIRWIGAGRPEEAVTIARELAKRDTSYAWNLPDIGLELVFAGRFREAVAVASGALKERPDDASTGLKLAETSMGLLERGAWTEAEVLLRECLKFWEAKRPDDWLTFSTRSMLGGSLLGQKKYAEAETLLVVGYNGMKARAAKIPSEERFRPAAAGERVVRLYEEWGKPTKAAEWRAKFEEASDRC
jgi:eukaryotic-like serine/threonine-protein kinase